MTSVKVSEWQEGLNSSEEDSHFIELKKPPYEDLTFVGNPNLVKQPLSEDEPLDPDLCHTIFGLEGCVNAEIVEVLPEIKEEDILSKFHFEDKDLTIVDEADVQGGEKKILVRQNDVNGFSCPLFCNFTCAERSRMVTHLINHRKRILTNTFDNEITFICPLCSSQFVMHTAFVGHIANHKKVPNLVCR